MLLKLSARAFYVACLVYLMTDTFQQSKHFETQNPEPDSSFVNFFSHSVIRRKLSIHMISLTRLSVCPFQSYYIRVFVERGSFSVVGVLSH